MGLFGNGLKGTLAKGLAIGVGAVILAPAVLPALRPVARAAIKGGIKMYKKGKESFAEVSEVVGNLVSEAKAEMAEAKKSAASPVTPE